ncbi:transposase [Microcoleus sp. LEGE 07076]|uniref:zinc ribbon domain-containing protein n=1 Tax=Microcoleus sp. LEGE 07076 TaxID=915322 RepID=UPI00187E8668|nr:zinc ribbon domain-containing protein [Microcoleus sp. LEGE 07076]MBE9188022.1 transposase [Microcoleus sp. LEGE 07076]
MFVICARLKLNNIEASLMARHAGLRLVAFKSWLSLRTQMYGKGKLSNSKAIKETKDVLTDRVLKQPELNSMNQLSGRVYQNALIDLKAEVIADFGFDKFPRQMTYKYQSCGEVEVLAQRGFPSYKICSNCGKKQDVRLQISSSDNHNCDVFIDRDLNVAINILNGETSRRSQG